MAPSARQTDFDAQFLDHLVGTKVTTYYEIDPPQELSAVSPASEAPVPLSADPPPGLSFPGSPPPKVCLSWIITEKLSESALYLAQDQVNMGAGPPMTVGKFLCHLEEDPAQIAFMRIYYQIPVTGTEYANLATRAQQGRPGRVCGEHEAFKVLMRQGCSLVPRFLGYDERMQGQNDLVPSGFIKYVVWEKVPGESLTEELFWSLDRPTRDDIRAKFRAAYEELLRCGVAPQLSRISKIIYDHSTGDIRISGFQRGWPILDKLEWSDTLYVAYDLAEPPEEDLDWSQHPENWEW
ncbi:uncharacterized protein N7458_012478 [Penicillium daleae]|uniref:Uncharacterized protein n=1 Tax=Penicillium daleae TaxID=63821 RepID=A0AAD6FXV8_9EURO|nr:uncharacterized protein N7458_012478 [Penicillium daleae]KAJ5433322.1 hypothetical protein N7458_012478 [Penicillium daleae]